jgi:hypothetical protein
MQNDKKDLTGLDRFYSKAIQSIGDFKNLLPDTDAQFRKSFTITKRITR